MVSAQAMPSGWLPAKPFPCAPLLVARGLVFVDADALLGPGNLHAGRPNPWFRGPGRPRWALLEDRILGALAFGEFGQRLASDQIFEMCGLLMCREGSFAFEHLVEEKLRGLAARSV